ncbi:hypothetical protein BLA50215_00831 [Burkholderia lata]|uniref:hypothetical protein n=1 Tax=Burkholderia lata (strain ATCC 17760 / DSM 23089 / LMG 22485 / NCIMB 9086 / R18194 / 383) TaxID=482957 RepID=UPI001452D500|nr:hypothetical protein [Burkholderia lata]VWC74811.1 hypothetical protein BLA50215_00831 [Burkholderia lata]
MTKAEREFLAAQGSRCHICGTDDFGTESGLPVGDHMPSTALAEPGEPQRLHSSCLDCSNRQGGFPSALFKAQNAAVGVAGAIASTAADAAVTMWHEIKNDPVGFFLWPVTSYSSGDGTLKGMNKGRSGF